MRGNEPFNPYCLWGPICCEPNGGKDESLETSARAHSLCYPSGVYAHGGGPRRGHFLQGPADRRTVRAASGHHRLGNRRADVRPGDTGRHLEHRLHWAVERNDDGSFPRPGGGRQKCAARDLAQHAGQPAHEPDDRDRHTHPGPGEAVFRRGVVRQRSQPVSSRRGNPRSGHSPQELNGPHKRLTRRAVATAQPSKSKPARTGLPIRGSATLAGKTFAPVIIGRNRFCPLIAANPAIARTCSTMAANSASQRIAWEDAITLAAHAGTISVSGPSSAMSLAT